jgi:hypothetical protein
MADNDNSIDPPSTPPDWEKEGLSEGREEAFEVLTPTGATQAQLAPRPEHYPLQAQPLPLWHVLLREMQLSPQALPAEHVLQHEAA